MLNLSPTNESRLRSALRNLTAAVLLLLACAVTASAYTLVLRDGRRLEIPSEFTLTRTTLTYEASPGFSKTMQLILINVAATERANNEAPGSFFKHAEETPTVTQPAPQARRTLTNRDLAAVRQRRIESERAYEKRRKELGLPTVEETRNRQEAEGAVLRAQLREKSGARTREETYWRERARELRTEIAMTDNQISYLRGRFNDVNESSLANRSWVTDVYPLWPNNRRLGNRQRQPFPNYPYPGNSYPYPGNSYPYPGNNYPYPGYRPARPVYGLGYPYGYQPGPSDDFDNSRTRAELTNKLDDLLVRRAGLFVQWRALEDEARDARVPQVWLEP
jgi:hypothetical protein